jgi:putative ABC transport system permease protein
MRVRSALLRTAPGVSPDGVAAELQAAFVSSQLVATAIASEMKRQLVARTSFLQLMQGYLALGLLVGVLGLGVVMVRSVRERRRTIGIAAGNGCAGRHHPLVSPG